MTPQPQLLLRTGLLAAKNGPGAVAGLKVGDLITHLRTTQLQFP